MHQCAIHGRPDQGGNGPDRNAHAHICSQVPRVVRACGKRRCCAWDDSSWGEADCDRVHHQSGDGRGSVHAEDDDSRSQTAKGKDIDLSVLVGENSGDNTSEGGCAVENSEKVRCEGGVDAAGNSVGREEEQRRHHAQKRKEQRCDQEIVARVLERRGQQERRLSGRQARRNGNAGEEHQGRDQKAHDAYRPAKPQIRGIQHLGQRDGEDNTADWRAREDDAQRGSALLLKVLCHGGKRRELQHRHANAHEHTLAEHEVPVLVAQRGEHHTEDVGDGSRAYDPCAVAVEERAGDGAASELDEDGQGADPGDLVGRFTCELVRHVVFLEDAERVGEAQAGKGRACAADGDEPSPETAVGRRAVLVIVTENFIRRAGVFGFGRCRSLSFLVGRDLLLVTGGGHCRVKPRFELQKIMKFRGGELEENKNEGE